MASERDLELLDDYVSNRLTAADKQAFEQRLTQDPNLQAEFGFQQKIAESLRKARIKELKQMLNNIPTSALPVDGPSNLARFAGAVALMILVATGFYFWLAKSDDTGKPLPEVSESISVPPSTEEPAIQENETMNESVDNSASGKETIEQPVKERATTPRKDSAPVSPSEPRKLDVFDPSSENESTTTPEDVGADDTRSASASRLPVEIDNTNKKYTFHYQLKEEKLILYGSFDKDLYEILEFITDSKRTVFLYYKNDYYLLNQGQKTVRPLSPVNDPALIKKLNEHRTN